jgi:hypothetical protein
MFENKHLLSFIIPAYTKLFPLTFRLKDVSKRFLFLIGLDLLLSFFIRFIISWNVMNSVIALGGVYE